MTGISSIGLSPKKADIVRAFSNVYADNVWQRKDTSGPGSSVESTGSYRTFLQQILKRHHIRRVIDVGCGLWEHLGNVNWENIEYLGVDPVPTVIERNCRLSLPPNIRFQCGVVEDVSNLASYDLAIVKDVLQHLPNCTINELLKKLRVVKYWLITNDVTTEANTDCSLGGFRKINMEMPPFDLRSIDKIDFPSIPFVKRTLLIQNDVGVVGPILSKLKSLVTA